MDANSLQTQQNLQPNKNRNKLSLEARHSISIEVSNKIRSTLSPRIFLPRLPISCYTTKSQYRPKEKFQNQNQYSKNFNISNINLNQNLETEKKCQNHISENFLQQLKGKYTNKSDFQQNNKIMENEGENKLNCGKRKRNKLEEKKKTDKQLKRRRETESKESNFQQNAKNEEPKKCENFKIIANENPTDNVTYLTDGDIIFIDDIDSMSFNEVKFLNSEKCQNKEEKIYIEKSDKNSRESGVFNNSQNIQINNEKLVQFSEQESNERKSNQNLTESEVFNNSQNLQTNNDNLLQQFNTLNFLETPNDLPDLSSTFAENSKKSPKESGILNNFQNEQINNEKLVQHSGESGIFNNSQNEQINNKTLLQNTKQESNERKSNKNSIESGVFNNSQNLQTNNENLVQQLSAFNFLETSNDLPDLSTKFDENSKKSPRESGLFNNSQNIITNNEKLLQDSEKCQNKEYEKKSDENSTESGALNKPQNLQTNNENLVQQLSAFNFLETSNDLPDLSTKFDENSKISPRESGVFNNSQNVLTNNEKLLQDSEKCQNKEQKMYEKKSNKNSTESEALNKPQNSQTNNENLVQQLNTINFLEISNDLPDLSIKFEENCKKSPKPSSEENSNKLYQISKENINENSKEKSTESYSKICCKSPTITNKINENFETPNKSKTNQHLDTETSSTIKKLSVSNSHKQSNKTEEIEKPQLILKESQANPYKNQQIVQLKKSLAPKTNPEKSSKEAPVNTKSPKSRKHYLTQQELAALDKDSLKNVTFENLLNTVSTSINDFKDFVKSSISQIYNCSPIDQQINEDLLQLESNMEIFSKFLLKTHNELDDMDRKTNNCLDNFNERYKRSQKSSSQETIQTDETLTILIEAHKMPIKKITFKMSEILNKEPHPSDTDDKITMETIASTNEQLPNNNNNASVKQQNLDSSINANLKLPPTREISGNISKHIRKKITPRKNKVGEITKNLKQNINENNGSKNSDVTTITSNPLHCHRFKKSSKLSTSKVTHKDSVKAKHSYNYSPATQNHISENNGTLYPSSSSSYHYSPQVPNQINSNYTNSNTIYPSPFNAQSQALYQSARNSLQHQHGTGLYQNIDYQKYPQNFSNPQSYYYNSMSYNSIFVDYLSNRFETVNESVNKRNQFSKPYGETHTDRQMQRPND